MTHRIPFDPTLTRRTMVLSVGAAAALGGWALPAAQARGQSTPVAPVTSHPRLWLTEDDLPRLRSWATDANPVWRDGLLVLADAMTAKMDDGLIPGGDTGGPSYEELPAENFAELFAFLSLVHPDEDTRTDYANRARTLLMSVIDEAARGAAAGEPFRDPEFSVRDRSRWWGEAFPLTVDWIYATLSDDDKATIRTVFLRWADENTHAATTNFNHPEPIGTVDDPVLLADPIALRWAGNNYFLAHMRNIGLMALSFDADDDPDGELGAYLEQATGAWLYMADALLRGDARGGLATEGFEYSQQALAYITQFLLALHTAGQADPEIWGPQVSLTDNPFWDEMIPAYLHSLSPRTVEIPDYEWLGQVSQPAWYGDGQNYWGPDFIGVFAPLGLYDARTGNTDRLDALRWIQRFCPPGGDERLVPLRVAESEEFTLPAMLAFLLFDPEAAEPADPHGGLPLTHFAAGLGRLLVRTGWDEDATLFTWALGWNSVDHQHSDGNQFEFYRAGEWLTKERTGYGFNIACSDYHNTLALENDPIEGDDPTSFTAIVSARGSQWAYVPSGGPVILARSVTDEYVYTLGDATNLYNSEDMLATDITHASRSTVWLRPDHLVVYDRAESKTDGRFKRFWLNLPTEPDIDGSVSTMTTDNSQQLVVTTLLPTDAGITSEAAEALEADNEPAVGEPMRFRLRVEAPDGPKVTRFLHVLQGVDAGGTADEVEVIESSAGTAFAGAVVNGIAVLFPVDLDDEFDDLTYSVPAGTERHLITGLAPGGKYGVDVQDDGDEIVVRVTSGGGETADDAGVLSLDLGD